MSLLKKVLDFIFPEPVDDLGPVSETVNTSEHVDMGTISIPETSYYEEDNFPQALAMVLRFEGGYVNDPDDAGGETNKGIIKKVYDKYRKSKKLPVQSVKKISHEEVEDIYKENYWLKAKCDKLPKAVALIHFDATVNCGVRQANKFLQRSVNAKADGVVGPKTLENVKKLQPKDIVRMYLEKRVDFYINLVVKNNSQIKFLKGWIRRALTFA